MKQESRPLRVGVIGLDERMRNALRLFFQGVACKNRCVMVEEDSAEAMIIDLDAYQGEELCNGYRQRHPDKPVILLSLHERSVDTDILLHKPLNTKALINALVKVKRHIAAIPIQSGQHALTTAETDTGADTVQPASDQPIKVTDPQARTAKGKRNPPVTHHAAMYLGEQHTKALIGTAPDIDPQDPQQLANAQYDPRTFLQSHLTNACKMADQNNRWVRMETPRGAIFLPPGGQPVLSQMNDAYLRTLSVVPIAEPSLTVSLLRNDPGYAQDDTLLTSSREALLWKSTLWASRGRVPIGTRLDIPVYLRYWPNLTRLLLLPHSMRIAALWANQPHSLLATAKTLAIPQRHVFSFYSAAHALGLASTSQRGVDTLLTTEPPPVDQRRGLLTRLLNRLRKEW